MNLNASTLIAGLVFGGIGFVGFIYGKKMSEWRPMVIGIALMGYPYVVSSSTLQWVIGVVLTIALFVFR